MNIEEKLTEDYCSFETAKLLKEKGFDVYVRSYYEKNEYKTKEEFSTNNALWNWNISSFRYSAPTLQMAMKWLREEYNLFIEIQCYGCEANEKAHFEFSYVISEYVQFDNKICTTVGLDEKKAKSQFKSYEEACEAAIKYCLENLIKNEDEEEESDIPVPKTLDEAISTLEKILSDEDRKYLLENGAISVHNSLGRWIRNEWGLWTGSELKDEMMNMNKGLNHPDDMSNYIIEEFIKYCLENLA